MGGPLDNRSLVEVGTHPTGKRIWKSDNLVLPKDAPTRWLNVFTGEIMDAVGPERCLALADMFSTFPITLLENADVQTPNSNY
jgi:maltooligosyltrehalose synthase